MDFKFTKFGFVNALLSLIPIFPAWTIFPAIFAAGGIEKLINDCELSYQIVLWVSSILLISIGTIFIVRLN